MIALQCIPTHFMSLQRNDIMAMLKNKNGFEYDDEKPKGIWQVGRRNFP